jgi:hypothetical protein
MKSIPGARVPILRYFFRKFGSGAPKFVTWIFKLGLTDLSPLDLRIFSYLMLPTYCQLRLQCSMPSGVFSVGP